MTVYFIRAGAYGPVKIGYAADPQKRLAQLQGCHYAPLRLIRAIPGERTEERWFQQHFKPHRIRGDWFKFQEQMMILVPPDGFFEWRERDREIVRLRHAGVPLEEIAKRLLIAPSTAKMIPFRKRA